MAGLFDLFGGGDSSAPAAPDYSLLNRFVNPNVSANLAPDEKAFVQNQLKMSLMSGFGSQNPLSVLPQVQKIASEAPGQAVLRSAVSNAYEQVPGTGVGTGDPRFAPRAENGQELAGPGFVPPQAQFNFNKYIKDPRLPMALASDPAAMEKMFAPKMELWNGVAIDTRNVVPGTQFPKVGENMMLVPDGKGGQQAVMIPGALKAISQQAGAKTGTEEAIKAGYAIENIINPATGQGYGVTRAQAVDAAKRGQPFTTQMAPGAKAEATGGGEFNIKEILTPAKQASDASIKSDQNISVLKSQLARTPLNQLTGSDFFMKAAGVAKAAGILTPEAANAVTDLSALRGAMSGTIMQEQLAQKGPQTESDAKRLNQSLNGMDDKTAMEFLLSTKQAQNSRTREYYSFLDKYKNTNGTLNGADAEWNKTTGSQSIFRTTSLKQYAPVYELNGKKYRVFNDGGDPEEVK